MAAHSALFWSNEPPALPVPPIAFFNPLGLPMSRRLLSLQTFAAALVAISCSSSALADNWAHWRGPTGNGTAPDATPPTNWSDSENIAWKVEIPGRGSGSPIVWEDKVFVATAVKTAAPETASSTEPAQRPSSQRPSSQRPGSQRPGGFGGPSGGRRGGGFGRPAGPLPELAFHLMCFERSTGKLLWDQVATTAKPHEGTHSTNGYASGSPCTDGEHVYAYFGSRGLFCYTLDGKLVWQRDFGDMTKRAGFGEGSSPTLAGDKIIVPWDHEGPSAIYALDKRTGKELWKTDRDEPTCWATPLIVSVGDKHQVIMNGQTRARAYDLETGQELWSCGGQTQRPVASAVSNGELVLVGSGFRGAFLGAFRPDGKGNLAGTKSVAWSVDRDTPDIASPLLSGNRLYFHKGKSGIITCLDASTGQEIFPAARVPGINSTYASPVAAGGFVYLTGRRGTTVVIRDSDTFEVISENDLGEPVDATPAIADHQIFIRGENHLYCIRSDK